MCRKDKIGQDFRVPHRRSPPQTALSKLIVFIHLSLTHVIFRIGKYNKNLLYDKIWGNQNGVPSNRSSKIKTFQPFKLDLKK